MPPTNNKAMINFSNTEKGNSGKQDEINLELTRTYFGGGNNRRQTVDRRNSDSSLRKKPNQKKQLYITLGIISVVLFILTFFYLLSVFVKNGINGNIAPSSEQVKTYTSIREPAVNTEETTPVPMVPPLVSESGEALLYDFEENNDGWGIPAWALNLRDHVAISTELSKKQSSNGEGSLRINSNFPKKQWSASLVEIQHFLNLENFDIISADIYFPYHPDKTLRGKIILTQGDKWEFNEMSHSFRINPGEWTTIWANISENSVDWKKKGLDKYFKNDIRKIAIRVESTKTPYKGPVYLDNIRVSTKDKFHIPRS